MAKVTISSKSKSPKPAVNVTAVEDDAPETAPVETSTEASTAESATEPSPTTAPPAPPKVSVKKSNQDLVSVVMLRTIDPSPVVGHVSVSQECGITILEQGKTYQLPRSVVEVLADAKAAAVIG